MSWVLMLLELIPTLFKVIAAIRGWIAKLPRTERPAARGELRSLAKTHVIAVKAAHLQAQMMVAGKPAVAEIAVGDAQKDIVALLERVKARATA